MLKHCITAPKYIEFINIARFSFTIRASSIRSFRAGEKKFETRLRLRKNCSVRYGTTYRVQISVPGPKRNE